MNPRRLRVPSVNKTAQAAVLPPFKGNLRLLWELHTKFPGFNRSIKTKWKSPPNEPLVSAGLKCLALGVASVNNTRLFTLLNYKRTRTENLLILRWKQNRLSQVLTLFYSRIPEQNFLFDMIYDCLFESIWFTFREQVAPALSKNLDKIKVFGSLQVVIRFSEWQAARSRRK